MTLKEIDDKISEWQFKLKQKTSIVIKVGKKKRKKSVGIPEHLARYYREELAKLYKERATYIGTYIPETRCMDIRWEDVRFQDSFIKLKLDKSLFSEPYQLVASRKSFELIKPYILKFDLPALKVLLRGTKIHQIENIQHLFNVIQVMTFKNNLNLLQQEDSAINVNNVLQSLQKLPNKVIAELMKIRNKGPYLRHLCEIQDDTFKIIPATEVFVSGNATHEEDTFIFTITKGNGSFVIWESVQFDRATYVFRFESNKYPHSIQELFEFIVTHQKHKRSTLRSEVKNALSVLKVIQHYNILSWKEKLDETLR